MPPESDNAVMGILAVALEPISRQRMFVHWKASVAIGG